MKFFITGGTGFVGTFLVKYLVQKGHDVTVLTPTLEGTERSAGGLSYLTGNPTIRGPWQKYIPEHDVIINMAGASIFSRWTAEQKEILRSSRLNTTRNLVEALPDSAGHITFFSTSAVGYYGFHGDEELTESSPTGGDFLARLAFHWEMEASRAGEKGARVILTRFGIVLEKNGGALGQMLPLFKYFLGGPLGSGRQWFSWIHMLDLAEAITFLLERPDISGPVNFCSPNPIRNKDLALAIGRRLRRPSFLTAPGFAIRLILGEFGSVLLQGQRVIPRRLMDAGYGFRYPRIEDALKDILSY
ncbi:MAG: TIGR01777 family oxidoreductase [Syntrophales bacterium]|nr:TIGR01777 family oxidoreductase [Syntrophales bacterium]